MSVLVVAYCFVLEYKQKSTDRFDYAISTNEISWIIIINLIFMLFLNEGFDFLRIDFHIKSTKCLFHIFYKLLIAKNIFIGSLYWLHLGYSQHCFMYKMWIFIFICSTEIKTKAKIKIVRKKIITYNCFA